MATTISTTSTALRFDFHGLTHDPDVEQSTHQGQAYLEVTAYGERFAQVHTPAENGALVADEI